MAMLGSDTVPRRGRARACVFEEARVAAVVCRATRLPLPNARGRSKETVDLA
jgi:hypothetical protein